MKQTLRSTITPLLLAIASYLLATIWANLSSTTSGDNPIAAISITFLYILCWLSLFWLTIRAIDSLCQQLLKNYQNKTLQIILPLVKNSLKIVVILLLINIALPYIPITDRYQFFLEKLTSLLLIAAITWITVQAINAFTKIILERYQASHEDALKVRKVYTQIHVLKKIIFTIIFTLATAAMLMEFENVRELGASLLASAGLATAIVGLAAQRSLSGLFVGLQIALNQTIRIGDAVLVENEFGTVEEIALTYVVIKTWDLRRLILPINHFIEKPFQNWTRNTTNLLCPVYLYTDYYLPVEELRDEFKDMLARSPLWDGNTCVLQVSNATDRYIEIRALASAADAGKAWDLRCELRENLIKLLRERYPHCLPKTREQILSNS